MAVILAIATIPAIVGVEKIILEGEVVDDLGFLVREQVLVIAARLEDGAGVMGRIGNMRVMRFW